jgi:hypothetical protein
MRRMVHGEPRTIRRQIGKRVRHAAPRTPQSIHMDVYTAIDETGMPS